jgi:hypothetical protein
MYASIYQHPWLLVAEYMAALTPLLWFGRVGPWHKLEAGRDVGLARFKHLRRRSRHRPRWHP